MYSISPEHCSWNVPRIRGTNMNPRLQLRFLLYQAGYRFRLHEKRVRDTPDIVLSKHHAEIFAFGCFWYQKFRRTVDRDREKSAEIEAAGWM